MRFKCANISLVNISLINIWEVSTLNNIENIRSLKRISQKDLAEEIGVSQSAVSQWESGQAFPSSDKLPQIAKILGCSIDDLFTA